jgi:two-component system sensor histidine kinase VicK
MYGLGLSVSRGIIEEHGGNISIKSNKGKGTEVTIKLKLADKKKRW